MLCFGTELVNNYLSCITRSPAHITGGQLDQDASVSVHYYMVYSHQRLIGFIGICPAASNVQPTRGRFHITAVDELSVYHSLYLSLPNLPCAVLSLLF